MLSDISYQQARKESVPIVSYLGTTSPTPLGRGLAPVAGVAHAEGTWKVFLPLTQPNRAGITCSVALQRAKAFFTVFCLGTTPSSRIEKPQHTEKSLPCRLLSGGVLSTYSLQYPQKGGHLPRACYPRRKTLRWPSALTLSAGGSLPLKERIKAVLARWVQLSHIISARKKKLIVTWSNLINLSRLYNKGMKSEVSRLVPGASSHLQHISKLCFFRNSYIVHERLRVSHAQ